MKSKKSPSPTAIGLGAWGVTESDYNCTTIPPSSQVFSSQRNANLAAKHTADALQRGDIDRALGFSALYEFFKARAGGAL